MVNNFRLKWLGFVFLVLIKKLTLRGIKIGVHGYAKFRTSSLRSKRKGVGQNAFAYQSIIS